ncbi:L-methionine transporter [Fomitopsis serialis]|uniref:L-methionine transporter n=1 Tax=Fomitopsis serialis TaxID=139415 RepID=UPI0020084821|nr:L-methionine transporter [Neoantrodia serialis]KAH9924030.1 L-methionine transporter [Neoantrodia serialis]
MNPGSSTLFDALKSPSSLSPHLPNPSYKRTVLSPRASLDSDDSDLRDLEISEGLLLVDAPISARGKAYPLTPLDFEHDLLPLTAGLSNADGFAAAAAAQPKTLGLLNGIALIVGLQIGSGIFSAPGVVIANMHSVGASLGIWLGAGLLAWTGASSFAELGSSIPVNGGAQAYLHYAYGPLVAYLFAWTAIIVLSPGGNAVISLVFAEYLNRLFWHSTSADASPDSIPQWAVKLTAVSAILFVFLICVATPNAAPRMAVMFTAVKISITVLGLVQLARGQASSSLTSEPFFASPLSGAGASSLAQAGPSEIARALYSGLWAFDGWNQANYVGGEMKDAQRNIPRAIHCSMGAVIILFFLANLSYFVVLDKATLARSNTVALDFGRALFGPVGGIVFALMVAISCFGALNGSAFTSSRLIYAAGKEGYLPAVFGQLNKRLQTPLNAMGLQATLTITFIVVGGGFRSLINFSVVAAWTFYFLTVLGVLVLRMKEPQLERPYKTWLTTPIIFCAVCIFLLSMPIKAAPTQALAAIGFILAGIPVYYMTQREELSSTLNAISIAKDRFERLRARWAHGDDWEAVSAEREDHVEMVDSARTSLM